MISDLKVSIVIPIYNCENYIKRSLMCSSQQTHENIEIIVVDDGSKDKSADIVFDFIKIDNRIKYYKQHNLGVSAARNKGVAYSTGNYILFLDADDIIENNIVEKALEKLLINKVDVVCFNTVVIEKDNSRKIINTDEHDKIYNKEELLKAFLMGDISHACWDKLYKKNVFDIINFPLSTTGEDRYFCWNLYKSNFNVLFTPLQGYTYIRRSSNSITSNKLSLKNLSRIEEPLHLLVDIKLHFPNLYEEWEYYYFIALSNLEKKFSNDACIPELNKYKIFIDKELESLKKINNKYIK